MNVYQINHVTNPDYAGYSEEMLFYVAGVSKKIALDSIKFKESGYYPVKKLSKKESKRIIKTAKKAMKEAKFKLEAITMYNSNSNIKRKVIKNIKREIRSIKKFYKKFHR